MNLRLIYLYVKVPKALSNIMSPTHLANLWLSRAAEIEVQSVVEHLTQGKTSPLSLCLTEAIEVAEAAKQSMVTEKQISVKK